MTACNSVFEHCCQSELFIHKMPTRKWTSLVTGIVKNLPAMQETWIRTLAEEDPLVKEMATHSSNLAWSNPWKVEPGRLQFMGSQTVGHIRVTNTCTRK